MLTTKMLLLRRLRSIVLHGQGAFNAKGSEMGDIETVSFPAGKMEEAVRYAMDAAIAFCRHYEMSLEEYILIVNIMAKGTAKANIEKLCRHKPSQKAQ